jgi:hypothetical protein
MMSIAYSITDGALASKLSVSPRSAVGRKSILSGSIWDHGRIVVQPVMVATHHLMPKYIFSPFGRDTLEWSALACAIFPVSAALYTSVCVAQQLAGPCTFGRGNYVSQYTVPLQA